MNDQPPAVLGDRDNDGRFLPGHEVGTDTRFGASNGNPINTSGRPNGVTYPGDWLRGMLSMTGTQLMAIVEDESAEESKRSAAQHILDMRHDDPHVRRKAFVHVLDRLEGRTVQRQVSIEVETSLDPADILRSVDLGIVEGVEPRVIDDQSGDTPGG